jgi:hypothetical protein
MLAVVLLLVACGTLRLTMAAIGKCYDAPYPSWSRAGWAALVTAGIALTATTFGMFVYLIAVPR